MAWYLLIISTIVSTVLNKEVGQKIRTYGVLILIPFFGIPFLVLEEKFKENDPFGNKKFWKYFLVIYVIFCFIAIVLIEITK